jgi:ABC-type lipoprotein release transport system permease subunit
MALIVILSVFNGFDELVRSLINSFNPDLKVTLAEGKLSFPMKQCSGKSGKFQAYMTSVWDWKTRPSCATMNSRPLRW